MKYTTRNLPALTLALCADLCTTRDRVTLCKNTVLTRHPQTEVDEEMFSVTLHGNVIMRLSIHGGIRLFDGGWRSVTTKQRLNALSPAGFNLFQQDGEWLVGTYLDGKPYLHGAEPFKNGHRIG